MGPAVFKGKKPISLILGNGRTVKVLTWKQLTEEILKDCISYPDKKQGLIDLCDNVSGRKRFFLSKSNEDMRSPIEIEKGIYIETHYDIYFVSLKRITMAGNKMVKKCIIPAP